MSLVLASIITRKSDTEPTLRYSVTSQPSTISTNSPLADRKQPGNTMREEVLGQTAKEGHLQVIVESAIRLDTAKCSPPGKQEPAAEGTDMSPSSKATNLLDKLLARSATLHRRLDSLNKTALPSSRTRKVQADPGVRRPGDIFDSCLSQAQELNDKVDRVSTNLKTPAMLMAAAGQEAKNGHPADNRPPKAHKVHVEKQTKGNTAVSSPLGCASTNEVLEVQREEVSMDQSPGSRAPMISHPQMDRHSASVPSCVKLLDPSHGSGVSSTKHPAPAEAAQSAQAELCSSQFAGWPWSLPRPEGEQQASGSP